MRTQNIPKVLWHLLPYSWLFLSPSFVWVYLLIEFLKFFLLFNSQIYVYLLSGSVLCMCSSANCSRSEEANQNRSKCHQRRKAIKLRLIWMNSIQRKFFFSFSYNRMQIIHRFDHRKWSWWKFEFLSLFFAFILECANLLSYRLCILLQQIFGWFEDDFVMSEFSKKLIDWK